MSQSHSLADRYGTSKSATRARRVTLWVLAVVALVAIVAWAVWANPLRLGPSAQGDDLGHAVVDASTVEVAFSVTATPGHAFACSVEALNTAFAVVGWKVFVYPASDSRIQRFEESVKTTELATTGFVSKCWLT